MNILLKYSSLFVVLTVTALNSWQRNRVDSSRTNPQEGSGLGLSIIRRIMEIFEGRVVIENVRPHGLRVILEFPKQGEES